MQNWKQEHAWGHPRKAEVYCDSQWEKGHWQLKSEKNVYYYSYSFICSVVGSGLFFFFFSPLLLRLLILLLLLTLFKLLRIIFNYILKFILNISTSTFALWSSVGFSVLFYLIDCFSYCSSPAVIILQYIKILFIYFCLTLLFYFFLTLLSFLFLSYHVC